ncbi:MAG TPA: tetratricopeptide repeat protein, partial [Planctomycetota bacterium]|nr:tetratricopeptide repeat protein [Planctomycetota bacterium]
VAVLNNLGAALATQHRFDESFECYEQLLRIDPRSVMTQLNYAAALGGASRFDRSAEHARAATVLDPKLALAHGALGSALWSRGRYAEARDASRRALELGLDEGLTRYTNWLVADCELRLDLSGRLSRIVDGSDRPASPAEAAEFGALCTSERKYARAVALYEHAFAAEPGLADDLVAGHRMSAAYSAAMLGSDEGEGAALDDAQRTGWRARARAWLNAGLELWWRTIESEPALRSEIRRRVVLLREDPRLAGLREPDQLASMSDDERRECVTVWRSADALLFRIDHKQ